MKIAKGTLLGLLQAINVSILLLCSVLCSGQSASGSKDSERQRQGIHVKSLLESTSVEPSASSLSTASPTPNPNNNPTAKTSVQAHEVEEENDNFHNERLPALSEDEYNNLGEDANPLHFLKQQPLDLETEEMSPPPEKVDQPQEQPQRPSQSQPQLPMVAAQSAGSPIYITIPIYISTGGKLPLKLTIGEQEMSLRNADGPGSSRRNPSTKAPNSHFNRLLQQIESPKRRTTNRHRSQLKSHIYAMKERKDRKDLLYPPMQ
ncbi:uncharacterized protein LOC108028060 [Drosophila biarmipes]|uniref:uncharacterized protein LOC108028060 n=1 Tax=Drosophila biarmipes TaxID=125945 RepID=UPI0021CCDF77|nr:uncharacterized protein LOC108028060 [Drosophila biarmipes]